MIDTALLRRALDLIDEIRRRAPSDVGAIRGSDASDDQSVATLARELQEAVAAGDEARVRAAVEELERKTRDTDLAPLSPDARRALNDLTDALSARIQAPSDLDWVPDLRRKRRRDGERGGAERPAAEEPDELRLTPHLDVEPPPPLHPGDRFRVHVYLDTHTARPGEMTEDFVASPVPQNEELLVEAWLRATSHFKIDGSPLGQIAIPPGEKESTRATFSLTVADPVPDAGAPGIAASFAHNLRPSGLVQRTIALALPDGLLEPPPPAAIRGGGAKIDRRSRPPDIEVEIHPKDGRKDFYDVTVRTADRVEVGEWALDDDSETYAKATMAQFFAKNASPAARVASLEGAGIEFFSKSPKCFKTVYWDLIDARTPPKTIYIVSAERAVPWELMIPRRRLPSGEREQHEPLGVECAIGRWHRESNITPGQYIPLKDSLVVAPSYKTPLQHAEAEVADVQSRFPGARVPATFDKLSEFFGTHDASLIHFICHGKDATIQTILLEGKDELTTQQVATTGLAHACQARRPLVFLNACEVGRPAQSLAGVGGFPASFIEEDASAVIAPLWAVDDGAAHQVATRFYAELVAHPETPFAEILRRLRNEAYGSDAKDTFAAYCFYGDPGAAIVPVPNVAPASP